MNCQSLFSGVRKKKYISKCRPLSFLPRVLSVKEKQIDSYAEFISVSTMKVS